ncbi:hypothetical protein M405DRAFT_816062 [Rhizopogon salebrosus TDB-379]|nr:hypothetical protein M405DRAFT_816062 [Rhizopogon salebrosus TDB-379]
MARPIPRARVARLIMQLLWSDPVVNFGYECEHSQHGPPLPPGTTFDHNSVRGCSYFCT